MDDLPLRDLLQELTGKAPTTMKCTGVEAVVAHVQRHRRIAEGHDASTSASESVVDADSPGSVDTSPHLDLLCLDLKLTREEQLVIVNALLRTASEPSSVWEIPVEEVTTIRTHAALLSASLQHTPGTLPVGGATTASVCRSSDSESGCDSDKPCPVRADGIRRLPQRAQKPLNAFRDAALRNGFTFVEEHVCQALRPIPHVFKFFEYF